MRWVRPREGVKWLKRKREEKNVVPHQAIKCNRCGFLTMNSNVNQLTFIYFLPRYLFTHKLQRAAKSSTTTIVLASTRMPTHPYAKGKPSTRVASAMETINKRTWEHTEKRTKCMRCKTDYDNKTKKEKNARESERRRRDTLKEEMHTYVECYAVCTLTERWRMHRHHYWFNFI